jgi:HEPN domain-containing protein
MSVAKLAAQLVRKADEDIHILVMLCDDQHTSDAAWGFHAQQAVEKLLKALLAARGKSFPFTHRLLYLADLVAETGEAVAIHYQPLFDLTPYAVELRYGVIEPATEEVGMDRRNTLALVKDFRQDVSVVVGA